MDKKQRTWGVSLLDWCVSASNSARSYASTSKAQVRPKLVCIDLSSLWIWYWLSRAAALDEWKQSERGLRGGRALWRRIATGCEIPYDLPLSDSQTQPPLWRWGMGGGGGGCWYRTRPMSQNAHLTLEGNSEEEKKNHFYCFSQMTDLDLRGRGFISLSSTSQHCLHHSVSLCSPQEVEHARAERRPRPW